MHLKGSFHLYLGFLLGNILLLCLQVRADATEAPPVTAQATSIPTTQNPASPSPTEASLTSLAPQETTALTTKMATVGSTTLTQTPPTQTSTSPPLSSTLPPEMPPSSDTSTAANTDEETVPLSEGENTADRTESCEEHSQKQLLICLIVIGGLVILCVSLTLATVALAIKLSNFKKRQPSKRMPRSNGDFLSTNSLWPAGLETLQRMSGEATGSDSLTQGPGLERRATGHGKIGEAASKNIASEISDRQKDKETSAKPQFSTVEI